MSEYDITINGTSIKDDVESFSIVFDEDSPFNSVSIRLNDDAWFDDVAGDMFGADNNTITTTPQVEVLTGVSTADTSQGLFFIERPLIVEDKTPDASSLGHQIWGRNLPALMDNPFTPPMYFDVSQHFVDQFKMASAVVEYICSLYGITVYSFDISDFKIYKDWTIRAFPIDIIKKIAETTDGYVRSTKDGQIWIKKRSYHTWPSSSLTIGNTSLGSPRIGRQFRYPDFTNRIRFVSRGEGYFTNVGISLSADRTRLSANGTAQATLTAKVTDRSGKAVGDGYAVSWTMDNNYGSLESSITYTTTRRTSEVVQASWFNRVSVSTPISSVESVILHEGSGSVSYGVSSFAGTVITLSNPLPYNNSLVKVTYYGKGFTENVLTAGTTADVSTFVHAMVEGVRDSVEISFGDPQLTLDLEASKTHCNLDENETEVVLEATVKRDGVPYVTSVEWGADLGQLRPKLTGTIAATGKANSKLRNIVPGTSVVTATIPDGSREGLSANKSVYFDSESGYDDWDDTEDDGTDVEWDVIPDAPTNLNLTVRSSSQIELTWTDNSDNEYGFNIYRKEGAAGVYESIGFTGDNETDYLDVGLMPSTKYYYKIAANNAAGGSAFSNEASATTLAAPTAAPDAPSDLIITNRTSSSVLLSWTDNSDNEEGFVIQKKKSTESADDYRNVTRVRPNTVSWRVSNLAANTLWDFRVASYNDAGQSAWATASLTTSTPIRQKDVLFVDSSGTADPDNSSTYYRINTDNIAGQTNTRPDMFAVELTNNSGYTIDASTVKAKLTGGGGGEGHASYFYIAWKENDEGKLPTKRGPIPNGGMLFATFYWVFEETDAISYTLTVVDDSTGDPVPNAKVVLNSETKYTDSNGQVEYRGLEADTTYPVVITATGYLDSDADDDTENDSITTQDLGDYDYSVNPTAWKVELRGDQY